VRSKFDAETAIEATKEPGVWQTHLSNQWNIGENPNGGYAASGLLRAAAAAVSRDVPSETVPLSVTAHFLRPALGARSGRLEADVVRKGRLTSTASGRLVQDGKERIRLLATFGTPDVAAEGAVGIDIPPVVLPSPEYCRPRETLEQGIELPITSRLEVLLDPALAEPGKTGRAAMAGWIRLRDGAPVDPNSLALFCDAFPPSPFGLLGKTGWVPTLEMTIHIRRIPVDGWIRARFETRDLAGGFLIEDGVLWDESGAVVAQCRQLALLRLAE
jgi:acyl-CoA thioesterase